MKDLRHWGKRIVILLFAVIPCLYVTSYGALRCSRVLVHQSSVDFDYPSFYNGVAIDELQVIGLDQVDLVEVWIYHESIGRGSRLDNGHPFDTVLEVFYAPLGTFELVCRGIPMLTVETLAGDEPSNDPGVTEEDLASQARLGPIRFQQIANDPKAVVALRQRR